MDGGMKIGIWKLKKLLTNQNQENLFQGVSINVILIAI